MKREYSITAVTLSKKVVCITEFEGKIREIPMSDVKGELPNLTVKAHSPIEAIRKYWRTLPVEPRPAKLTIGKKTYIVNWAGWNEHGGGRIGWWCLRNEDEYKQLRSDGGHALFELPRYRLLTIE